MAALLRLLIASESSVLKTCSPAFLKSFNGECAFSVKKLDLPAPPKRPLTAYMLFCKENRQNILKEEPNLTTPQQIKRLAAKWCELNNDMKKPYELSARKSTLIYGEAHKKFYESLTEEQKDKFARQKEEKKASRRKLKLNRALQKTGIPKSPGSAYALFVQSEAKKAKKEDQSLKEDIQHKTKWRLDRLTELLQSPKLSSFQVPKRTIPTTDFIKQTAEKWKKLSPEVKERLEKEAVAAKQKFESEMEAWKKQMSEGNSKLLKEFEESTKRKPKTKTKQEI